MGIFMGRFDFTCNVQTAMQQHERLAFEIATVELQNFRKVINRALRRLDIPVQTTGWHDFRSLRWRRHELRMSGPASSFPEVTSIAYWVAGSTEELVERVLFGVFTIHFHLRPCRWRQTEFNQVTFKTAVGIGQHRNGRVSFDKKTTLGLDGIGSSLYCDGVAQLKDISVNIA